MPPIQTGEFVLDASVAINVLAATHGIDILKTSPARCVMEARAAKEVSRHPRGLSQSLGPLGELLDASVLTVVQMEDPDYEVFVQLVGAPSPDGLDDGEAASIALAAQHGGILFLDESKARRICRRDFPELELRTSIDLFRQWWNHASVKPAELSAALKEARHFGRMRVLKDDQKWFDANTKA